MPTPHPLLQLQALGQSPWLDNIQRQALLSGELAQMIEAGDITGLTSNPSIFEKAIAQSTDYDDALGKLALTGTSALEIFDALAIEDIQSAADHFRGVYDRTDRHDGYVSIEVAPNHAHDTQQTLSEAKRLWQAVNRPNLMIKIPATAAGLPAIQAAIADGINVNVTLIFSIKRYKEVMQAYLSGLRQRHQAGQPLAGIASVASFFVSRLDSLLDDALQQRIDSDPALAADLQPLMGKAAVANARLAYQAFKQVFGDDFDALRAAGAQVQRPLWASTSTKNKAYSDVLYVETLIGPDTVNTLPPNTLLAFKDHGTAQLTIDDDLADAEETMTRLAEAGIDVEAAFQQLEDEGVAAFFKSFDTLLQIIENRRQAVLHAAQLQAHLPQQIESAVATVLAEAEKAALAKRLWQQDSSLWQPDDPAHQAEIKQRLGWLTVYNDLQPQVAELTAFAAEMVAAGYRKAVLCGMGGSSLAPDVFRAVFGVAENGIDVRVLDSTHPAAVAELHAWSDPAKTLYIIASKSGGTLEVVSFMNYFWAQVQAAKGHQAGENFIAITDPNTGLGALAAERGFRRVFINPPEIGGRFSALSLFGLLPAALLGIDLNRLLGAASAMAHASTGVLKLTENAGLWPGLVLAALAQTHHRDKVTFITSAGLANFGDWLEQLIAESTGKARVGLLPVVGEPILSPDFYGSDRIFVYLRLDAQHDAAVQALIEAGHPVLRYDLPDIYALGGELLRWQLATAAASWVLGVNPFDQPNVQSAKTFTSALMKDKAGWVTPQPSVPASSADKALESLLAEAKLGDYLALLAFMPMEAPLMAALSNLQAILLEQTKLATTVGYGPRFLHSTGQLHKGGANTGLFIQLVNDGVVGGPNDLQIPTTDDTFGEVIAAQALGDFQALQAAGRRVLRLQLSANATQELTTLAENIRNRST